MTSAPRNSSHPSSGTNALDKLEIPGRTNQPLPEPPAAPNQTLWGINHGAVLDNFPQNGLQLYIPAWSTMGTGDSVSVSLLSDPEHNPGQPVEVTSESITAEEVNQRVTAFIQARHLNSGIYTLWYDVKRLGQEVERSDPTDIMVKIERPGGKDQDGDTPGHSALKLSMPQEIVLFGVDEEDAKAGVPVTIAPYPEMAEWNVIKLSWGGKFVYHQVTAEEVNQPIVITVEEAVILEAGDSDNEGLAVTYEVYDIVDNRSEDWAAEIRITVRTDTSRLPSPIVREATSNVLDLDTLGSSPVTVVVWASNNRKMTKQLYNSLTPQQAAQLRASMGKQALSRFGEVKDGFILGDRIVVKLTGTTAEGQQVIHEAAEVIIDDLPDMYEIQIPNAVVRQLAQTQAAFSYYLLHQDSTRSESNGAFISVIGEAVRMAAPVALDAAQGAINPNLPITTVQIPWDDSMAAGNQLVLKWIGTRPDLSIYDPLLSPHNITNGEATNKAPINITVPGTHLKAIEGGTLGLYFILIRDVDGTPVNRESARAATLNIGPPLAELPAPAVAGIDANGVMDPQLPGTKLTVTAYREMAIGDEVHYLWHGIAFDVEDWITITSLTLNKDIVFEISQVAISGNKGGTVEASYWVKRADRRSDSEKLVFSIGQPVVLDPPVISSITDSNEQEIPDNGSTTDTSVTLRGTAAPNLGLEVFDGTTSQGKPAADADGQWMFGISGLAVTSHAIKAKGLYGDQAESAVRTFSVNAMPANPVITSIKDSNGDEIPDHGTTSDRRLTFAGTSYPNLEVKLLDAPSEQGGGAQLGTVMANANGQWTLEVTVPEHSSHRVWILGNGAPSRLRYFTLV